MSAMSQEFNSLLRIDESQSVFKQACDLQAQAATVGFDWPNVQAVLEKVDEELAELKEAITEQHGADKIEEELADLLFVLVNVGRHLNAPLESVLPKANQKFVDRFRYIEQQANAQQRNIAELTLDEMEALWCEAKGTSL